MADPTGALWTGKLVLRVRSSEQGAKSADPELGAWTLRSDLVASGMSEKQFRFQDLEVWQRAAALTPVLFRLTENLEKGQVVSLCRATAGGHSQHNKQHRGRFWEHV